MVAPPHAARQASWTTSISRVVAKHDFGIDCVEYVNQFFKDKAKDTAYLTDLKKRCDDNGVTSGLIMFDGEGDLGDPDDAKRTKAVENHYKWVEAAKFLGCHSIRVNAHSEGSYDEQMKLAADGLRRLSEFGAKHDMNVIVENHGGLSSNGEWLAGVMKMVGLTRTAARCPTSATSSISADRGIRPLQGRRGTDALRQGRQRQEPRLRRRRKRGPRSTTSR